jgi:hypothetical protein
VGLMGLATFYYKKEKQLISNTEKKSKNQKIKEFTKNFIAVSFNKSSLIFLLKTMQNA